MADPPTPNYLVPPSLPVDPPLHLPLSPPPSPPPPPPPPPPLQPSSPPLPPPHEPLKISEPQPQILFSFPKRPPLRVTSEFDSENGLFFHRLSCKLFDGLAKLKLSLRNNRKGEIADPLLTLSSKHVSVFYDVEENNAIIQSSFDVGPRLHFNSTHDVKARQGELAMVADLTNPGYAFQLSSPFPALSLPKATLKFPLGEVSLEEREEGEEEVRRALSINGVLKGRALNGVCTALFSNEDLKLRYRYKDEEMAFIPSVSLPSNALSFAFKRRFNPSNKLSYWYNFDTNYWNAVYKQTYGKDFKFKAGYDSAVRLGWASLWVGDEGGKAKTAPMKVRVELMMQVPQDNINAALLTFRVKKRWDI